MPHHIGFDGHQMSLSYEGAELQMFQMALQIIANCSKESSTLTGANLAMREKWFKVSMRHTYPICTLKCHVVPMEIRPANHRKVNAK
jgi:hypothetical protein